MTWGEITRRTLLRGAAGSAALLAYAGLPAWARQFTATAAGIRRPDSLPFPHLPAGHASMPQIEHVVVLMMENHSFDNLLGMVPYEVKGRAGRRRADAQRRPDHELQPRRQRQPDLRDPGTVAVPAALASQQLLELVSRGVRKRHQQRLRDRRSRRSDRDEHLGRARPAVHLLTRAPLPDRRTLLLLGPGPDVSQPPLLLRRHVVGNRRRQDRCADHAGRQRHDLGSAGPRTRSTGAIYDGWRPIVRDRPRLAEPRPRRTASSRSPISTKTRRTAGCRRSRSWTRTTPPPRRRTRRTSSSESGSSPASSRR